MILVGIVLLVLGAILGFGLLWWLGGILVVVGVILFFAGGIPVAGRQRRPIGGRRYWY